MRKADGKTGSQPDPKRQNPQPERKERREVMRQCVACRARKPKAELLRVVRWEGTVLPDPTGRAPGRGAYLCRSGGCLQVALREQKLNRSLGCTLTPETEAALQACWDQLNETDTDSRIYNLLGLGRRGRRVVCGTRSVEAAVRRGEAALVILAADAARNGAQALESLCAARKVPLCRFGAAETLGRLTGKDVRTALAVTDPGLAEALQPLLHTAGAPASDRDTDPAAPEAPTGDRAGATPPETGS